MKIPGVYRNMISAVLLATVGAVFVFKYSARINDNVTFTYIAALIYTIGFIGLIIIIKRINFGQYDLARSKRSFLVVAALIILVMIVMVSIAPEISRVSRLPAIREWLGRLLTGQFPWGGQTNYYPSGFPVLFLIALPFHAIGLLGYLEIVGVILFFIALVQFFPQIHSRWFPLVALLPLPTMYYELLVRSELFFNIILIVILILLSERYLDTDRMNLSFFGLAVLFGLGLSTRTVVGIIYAGYYAYKFRIRIWHGIIFSMVTLIVFGLTLVPFFLWDSQTFLSEGPFSIQMTYIPSLIALAFTVIAAFAGWKAADIRNVVFSIGAILFLIVCVAFLLSVAQNGLHAAVFNDKFDITYFIFCTPFLLLSLDQAQNFQATAMRQKNNQSKMTEQ